MRSNIKKVGRAVREAIKELHSGGNLKKYPYFSADYLGWCAIVSYCIRKMLGGEVVQGAFHGDKERSYIDHTWVEYQDYVIDATAQQFEDKLPEVLIVKKKKYSGLAKRRNCTYAKFKDWPDYQRPTHELVKLINKTAKKYL